LLFILTPSEDFASPPESTAITDLYLTIDCPSQSKGKWAEALPLGARAAPLQAQMPIVPSMQSVSKSLAAQEKLRILSQSLSAGAGWE